VNQHPRPLSVTIIACLYLLTGAVGLVYHLSRFHFRGPFEYDIIGISTVSVVAIVAGAFMLRGADWARWLALAWMAFHVGISYLNGWSKVAMHAVFLVVIGYFLLRREAREYFSSGSHRD
jgi:hypothetical protein